MSRDRNPWAINTEILTENEIKEFFVNEDSYLGELKDNESYLVEGCRGVGKTMLMRYSQITLLEEYEQNKTLPVYVSFSDSLKLDRLKTNNDILKKELFIRWTISKILNSLIKTYTQELEKELNLKTNFQRFFKINNYEKVIEELPLFIYDLEVVSNLDDIDDIQKSYQEIWNKTVDIGYFKQFVEEFIDKHNIKRVIFYFDEAAHTLFPYQQELFFTIFKKLKSKNIACKASVYPLITNYGNDFQPSQDAKKIIVEKDDESNDILTFFQEFYSKRIEYDYKREILKNNLNNENFRIISYASSANPRRFLNLIEKIRQNEKLTASKLTQIIREHAHNELWEYHNKLSQGNIDLRAYVEIGKKFINEHIVPTLQKANSKKNRDKKFRAFSIDSDVNSDFSKMLKTLEYSGIIDFKKRLKLREGDVGNYYTLNLSLCFAENIINIKDIGNTELRRCPSLSANSKIIQEYTKKIVDLLSSNCPKCDSKIDNSMKFCPNCGNDLRDIESVFEKMVKQPINLLKIELIGYKIMDRLQVKFKTIKELMDADDSDILKIYLIGARRLKNIRIAISDYISG